MMGSGARLPLAEGGGSAFACRHLTFATRSFAKRMCQQACIKTMTEAASQGGLFYRCDVFGSEVLPIDFRHCARQVCRKSLLFFRKHALV
jgi:hypothetical protein